MKKQKNLFLIGFGIIAVLDFIEPIIYPKEAYVIFSYTVPKLLYITYKFLIAVILLWGGINYKGKNQT
ncbi:hypothetical protein [Leptobacterium sp. I13]|uniref:hypothetical protein n=1 Tax=Leptobacterium meishanense TaxID=3128904 RepID=UPI0030EBFAC9